MCCHDELATVVVETGGVLRARRGHPRPALAGRPQGVDVVVLVSCAVLVEDELLTPTTGAGLRVVDIDPERQPLRLRCRDEAVDVRPLAVTPVARLKVGASRAAGGLWPPGLEFERTTRTVDVPAGALVTVRWDPVRRFDPSATGWGSGPMGRLMTERDLNG